MEAKSSRFAALARRGRTIAAGAAIAAIGIGFTACGDDEQQNANDAVDDAQQNIESALDEVDTEELQQQAEEAQQSIEEGVDDAQQQAEELQEQYGGEGN